MVPTLAFAVDRESPGPDEISNGVTLSHAMEAALDHYQPMRLAEETVYQLVRRRHQALAALLPTLSFEVAYTGRTQPKFIELGLQRPRHSRVFRFSVVQPLFAGGRGMAGLKEASTQVKVGEQTLHQTREEILLDVAEAFYAVLKAEAKERLFRAEVGRLREHRQAAAARLRVGDVTRTVLLRAEAELAGAEAALIRARSDIAITKEGLTLLTGLPFGMAVIEPPDQVPPDMPAEALIDYAQSLRPELLQRRLEREAATQALRVARADYFPTLSLQLTYQNDAQSPASSFLVKRDKFAFLKLTFPLFEGGLTLAKVQEARSQLRVAALDAQFIENSVSAEVRNALQELEALRGAVEQFTAQVRFAKENYELTSRQFAVGLATNLDLLDANSTLLTAEQDLALATYDRAVAVFRLYKSYGQLSHYVQDE